MRYELLLQSVDPTVPYDPAAVDALLTARGMVRRLDGARSWPLKHGDVEIGDVVEGGRQIATEVRIPLREHLDLVSEALAASAELAEAARVRLFDPQLLRTVRATDDGAVCDQYLRTARYAGEMMGVSEALGASIPPPDDQLLKPGTKVLLGVIAFFVVLLLLLDNL